MAEEPEVLFSELKMPEALMAGVQTAGFTKCTPIQAGTLPLALQGKAGEAIGIATTSSFLGSTIALFFMAFFTPYLGQIALRFQSFEFFWLTLFGVLICGNLTAPEDPLKGWISGFLGLFLAMIGMEAIQAYPRFAYRTVDL